MQKQQQQQQLIFNAKPIAQDYIFAFVSCTESAVCDIFLLLLLLFSPL